jgi:nitroimidazol reductase NimA-like FMN-containing flavoprotein (pyridoxamine 5'-phosphate oxidase superfamily)
LSYTQSPPLTSQEIESFLKETKIARFCSFNEDGTIHATPVWFLYENGQILLVTPYTSRKARNVRRNKNVTILVDIEGPPVKGVIIYGKTEVAPSLGYGDEYASEVLRLLEKYVPRDKAEAHARSLRKLTKWVMIRVIPERIVSFDYSKDEAYRTAVAEVSQG